MLYIFLVLIFSVVYAFEQDLTISVQAGKLDCIYQKVMPNEVVDIEYQVIDSTHGDLDISFNMADPQGRIIVADYKKSENSHQHTSTLQGDYRFCFDNTFSTFSVKTVFFDLLIQKEDADDISYDDDDKEMELGMSAEAYMMKVGDISSSILRVQEHVSMARRLQELHSAHEARDRNLAEGICTSVLTWSMWQIVIMIVVGITQVFFVKSLFSDMNSSRINRLMAKLSR